MVEAGVVCPGPGLGLGPRRRFGGAHDEQPLRQRRRQRGVAQHFVGVARRRGLFRDPAFRDRYWARWDDLLDNELAMPSVLAAVAEMEAELTAAATTP